MKETSGKIRVMLVDDHRVLTESLAALLKAEGDLHVCGVAGNLAEAEAVFKKARPDVVLLDLNLGADESGFTFLQKVKASALMVRVVIVSTFDGETFRSHARSLGADDYVAKGASTAEIVAAIRGAVRRNPVRPGGTAASADGAEGRRRIFEGLSDSERKVVKYLTEGLSQKEIAAEMDVSASTVGTYVQRARDKFGARSLAHLVSIVESVIAEGKGKERK